MEIEYTLELDVIGLVCPLPLKPIVIKGGVLKSINQYYNKRRAELQSIYDKQGNKAGAAYTGL